MPEALPMALGQEPQPGPVAGPFNIQTTVAGNGYLYIRGTGMAFTACMSAHQLRQLASMATAAAAEIETGSSANVVSIFGRAS